MSLKDGFFDSPGVGMEEVPASSSLSVMALAKAAAMSGSACQLLKCYKQRQNLFQIFNKQFLKLPALKYRKSHNLTNVLAFCLAFHGWSQNTSPMIFNVLQ